MIPDHAALPEEEVDRLLKNDREDRYYRRCESIHEDVEYDTQLAIARGESQTDEEMVASFQRALARHPK